MSDAPAPTYRFWGHQKPIAFAAVADASAMTGKSATMRLYGPVDSWGAPFGVSADEFAQALDALGSDVESIELHLHSPGGEVFEGLAIMNQLKQHPAAVNAVVDGIAASIASVIAMGADTVAMAPGAQMMIHDAAGICIGTAEDMATMRTALESLSSNIADVYAARAGGSAEDWRGAMQPESWYKAQEAVDAGLADRVLAKDEAPAQPKASFDLSMFAHAGRDDAPAPTMPANRCRCGSNGRDVSADPSMEHKDECPTRATKTPADQPVTPPTDHKEADTMSDTIPTAGLVKALGLPDDADEDTILEAVEAKLTASAAAPKDEKPPAAEIPEGKVLVSQNVLDELRDMAQSGVQARAKQLADERDEAIQAAFAEGKISAERKTAWSASWDKDPEGTKADLASLPVRFPVAKAPGVPSSDADVDAAPFTDDEADALGALAGLPKGALR